MNYIGAKVNPPENILLTGSSKTSTVNKHARLKFYSERNKANGFMSRFKPFRRLATQCVYKLSRYL